MHPRPLRLLLSWAAELLAPTCCAACAERLGAPLGGAPPFCGACAADAVQLEPAVERLASGLRVGTTAAYGGPVARAVQRLKYEGHPELGAPLGRLVANAVRSACEAESATVVVPVPLHAARLAERGYNQSALVGRSAAAALGLGFMPLALSRARRTREQASLDRRERAVNVAEAFVASRRVSGERVVLVDDVVTTGATAEAAARAVTRAGGIVVLVAAIARTPTPQ